MLNFIRPTVETEPLFNDFVIQIVEDRLHLKTYSASEVILDENEKMDSLNVILEGHVLNIDDYAESEDSADGNVYILYPNEILALECIKPIDLSMHYDLDFNFEN